MATFRVFEFPNAMREKTISGENIRLIPDGFSFLALIFPFIWLFWHRLWLALGVYLVLVSLFVVMSDWINPFLGFFLNSLVGLYIGFEGNNWRTSKLVYNGWEEVDVILASNVLEAELRFFDRRSENTSAQDFSDDGPESTLSPSSAVRPRRAPQQRSVIGGFPVKPAGSRL